MFYRDFMQKYRPLYAPDGPAAGSGEAQAAAAAAGEAAAPAAGDMGVTSAEGGAAAAPAAAGAGEALAAGEAAAAPAAGAEAPKSEPSLLEAATGKKPDAAAAADGDKKDSPAPAEAAKPEGDVKADGDKKPETEAAKDAKPEEGKDPKDAAKADPDKKDATAEAQPPAPIKYEAFKLPDGVKLDDERFGKFTEFAGTKQISQDVAQGFLDLHIEEMNRFAADVVKQAAVDQRKVWNTLNDTWKSDMRKDPEIGGNRVETSLSRAKAVIEEYLGPENGGSAELVQDLLKHTSNNGMGNFPPFVRLLNKIGEVLNIFEDSPVGGNLNPPKAQKSPGNRGWYNGMPGTPQA